QCRLAVRRRPGPSCWRIELPARWSDYLATLSKQRRKKLRRLERMAAGSGPFRARSVHSREDLLHGQRILIQLHQRRWEAQGQPGCFASARFRRFHCEVMSRLLEAGQLRLDWLELDGQPVAAEYQLTGAGVVYAYQSGMEPKAANHSPGTLSTLLALRRSIAEGFRAYDLLRGDEPYKSQWAARPRPGVEIWVAAPRASARLRHGARVAASQVKGLLGQSGCPSEGNRPTADRPRPGRAGKRCSRSAQTARVSQETRPRPMPSPAEQTPRTVWNPGPLFQAAALHAYYYGSYPLRCWAGRWRRRRGRAPVIVLFYHRIADDRATQWTTTNGAFRRQLQWLAARVDLISLEEAQRRIRAGWNERTAVSITFDDGYTDNATTAIPWLVEHRIPCTYFVTLRNVLEGRPFPHDLAAGYRFAPNTLDQLRWMAEMGVEIGAHTYSHPDLGQVTDERRLRREIVTVKGQLEGLLGRPVRYLAFPFGQRRNLRARAFQLARQAGYEAVCSAYGGYNFPGDDPFHLQRFHGDEELVRLKNRVTVDPRLLGVPRFDYSRACPDGVDPAGEAPSADEPWREPAASGTRQWAP
ncbi:MAG TPA: GNAT family N-acetyltransferase, partial [Planctomycetes bacterium]|nr:GNAT family N-acetyltransferase [Planctomycetota bacterium]